MKKIYKKIISVILMIIICLQVSSAFCVSNADSGKVYTYKGNFFNSSWTGNISKEESYRKEAWEEFKKNLNKYKSTGSAPSNANVNNIEMIGCNFTRLTAYWYTYDLKEVTYKEEEYTKYSENKESLLGAQRTINSTRKFNGYPITKDAEVVKSTSNPSKYILRVKYKKKYEDYSKRSTASFTTNKSFESVVGVSTASQSKNVEKHHKNYIQNPITIKFRVKDDSSQQQTTNIEPSNEDDSQVTPSDSIPQKNIPIDNKPTEKQTETLDNGTSLQNAIDFVNQVFDIKEANKDNQAVKDLVNKTKTATDITAAELTNINANDSLSTEDFSKQAYKRALGRDANEEELKDITDNNYTFSDIISKLVSSDEFKEICNKYNLEVGSYVPVVFNQGTTQEKATNFVKHEFSIIMGREPTEAELNAIVPNLVNGKINASIVVSAIFESSEFKNKELDDAQFIKTLVKATTNQDINEKVTSEYTQRLSSGTSRNDLIQELLRHSKFQSLCSEYSLTLGSYSPRAITPTQELADKFNTQVSKSILGSNANVIQSLSSYLTSGKYSAGDFIRLYVESDNFAERVKTENMSDADYVMSLFKATLQREPTSEELTEYLSKINQNDKSSILTEMLNTGEFASVCNKYYLPVVKYEQSAGNGEKRETIEDKSKGAIITKIKNTDTTGKTTEIVKSVKFDISKKTMGDVNGDGEVNSSDASLVLIYAAALGSNPDLFETQKEYSDYADINKDGVINASDAALILIYAAKYGATGNTDWNEVVNN